MSLTVKNIIDSENCLNNIFHCQLFDSKKCTHVTIFTVSDIFHCQLTFFTVNDIFHCQVDFFHCQILTVKIVLAIKSLLNFKSIFKICSQKIDFFRTKRQVSILR